MRSALCVIGLGVVLACTGGEGAGSRANQAAAPAIPPPPRPPIVIGIADAEAKEVKPAQYIDYKFTLPARRCVLSGKIEGITGGNKDFEAFIMNDENFRNWAARLSAQGVESGRKVVWSFSEQLMGPGDWHLVVSNAFSAVTAKAITVSASANCPG